MPATITLETIEQLTKNYAAARAVVSERVNALDAEIQDAHRRKLPGIKSALAEATAEKAKLEAAIDAGRDLFVKPRTVSLHGIKCGLKKGSGKIEFADEAGVIARIKRFLKAKVDALISTKETVKKKALLDLTVEELAKIGCKAESTGDHVYISAEDSNVDKLVARILKEGQGEELDAAA